MTLEPTTTSRTRRDARGRRRARFEPRAREGMTLIEVMIVVLIIAVAATGLSYGFGALNRTQLRSACMRLTAASRFAYNRAISRGTTVRIALDFSADTMAIEEAHGRITLARTSDSRRRAIEDESEDGTGTAAAVDPWEAARARLADTLHPSFGASPFETISGRRYTPQPVAEGVEIERLLTPHEADPRERGTGHIYFFPHGQTEHAVVWLSDGGDTVFSVEIHPLSGRARVRASAYEPEELLVEGDESTSEVRD
jgi:general secretion pathway protein H